MLRAIESSYGYAYPVALVLIGLVTEWSLIGLFGQ